MAIKRTPNQRGVPEGLVRYHCSACQGSFVGAYEFDGLGTVTDIRRLLEVAAFDTLGLENSVARSRAIAYLCQVAYKGLEVGQMEERLAALEETVRGPDPAPAPSL